MYCRLSYSHAPGELEDGILNYSTKDGYIYEFHTQVQGGADGDSEGFEVHIGAEKLYISQGAIEKILIRDDDFVEEESTSYAETSQYETLCEDLGAIVTSRFEDADYAIEYNDTDNCVNIYIESPYENKDLRAELASKDTESTESWYDFCSSFETICDTMYTITGVGYGPDHCSVYMVDTILPEGVYGEKDYVLRADDGLITYNYADTVSAGTASDSPSGSSTPHD